MKRAWWLGLLVVVFAAGVAPAEIKPTPSHSAPRFQAVTLVIRHRVFHDFIDEQRAALNKDFVVGDTDFKARVVQYVPDFMMDLQTRKITSRTEFPNNPAFKIIVWQKGVPQDTAWALLNLPPHFARKSMLAFRATKIEFAGRPPMYPDTTKVSQMMPTEPMQGMPGDMKLPPGHVPVPPPGHPPVPPAAGTPEKAAPATPAPEKSK
jgi:hypothetical protein